MGEIHPARSTERQEKMKGRGQEGKNSQIKANSIKLVFSFARLKVLEDQAELGGVLARVKLR